ncbi:RIP metalloprotease RseP [Fundicoccus ignavus]|uniref:Zinc metalloprotease n=1 Tax=Fundicoccus ignavus TaxID=2664442 RepID=A0A844C4N0_9LACT|nr:RIP metalloprotease RseP [Fundicoccus ignavus]MRJ48042.1 RIP metalloprotease RseP [Fundicoccus ignavus]
MQTLQTIIVFLIIFSIIVVIHEFGHYYFAKRAGILVREFAIGMGPKLFAKQGKDGTTYTIRMLPLGGYVRLAGLNEEEAIQAGMQVGLVLDDQEQVIAINTTERSEVDELPVQVDQLDLANEMYIDAIPVGQTESVRYSVSKIAQIIEADGTRVQVSPIETRYESANVWQKMMTNFAGPMNNFILSVIVFAIVGLMMPAIPSSSSEIGDVIEGNPAAEAGMLSGDRIIEIDGQSISSWNDVLGTIQSMPGETVIVVVERDNQALDLTIEIGSIQVSDDSQPVGQIGVYAAQKTGLIDRLLYGFTATWGVIASVLGVLGSMFTKGFDINMFGGPVAMAEATSEVVNQGYTTILYFMALLSTNLGIVNLLPIPALDGGKIVLNLIEAVRGKPLSQEKEGIITIIGVIFLFILMIAVTWNDISRVFF